MPNSEIMSSGDSLLVECLRCGQLKEADCRNPHLCVDCAKAENNRYSHARRHQENWLAIAEEACIQPWLKQPSETDWEYTIWCAYRDQYPGKKPSYGDVARQLKTTTNVVRKASQRWTFQARMQAWIAECDRATMAQRRSEILAMNADHISMSEKLRSKLSQAIELVDPVDLKPSDIVSLAKLAAELERKARTDTMSQEALQREAIGGGSDVAAKQTPNGDLGEVVKILLNAGALESVTQIGVRETTTREVVLKDATSESSIIQDVIDE